MARLVYRLAKQKKNGEGVMGFADSPFPFTRSLSRFHRVRQKDPTTGKIRVRMAAYAPNETSIFVDEWSDSNARTEKVRFEKGFCVVDPELEPQKVALLEILNENGSNPDRDTKVDVKYIRIDKNKDAENFLKNEERVTKELLSFWSLDYNTKRAIANSFGITTYNIPEATWSHQLYAKAKMNIEEFTKMVNNSELPFIDVVSRAEALGVIRIEAYDCYFGDMPIAKLVVVKNKYTQLADLLINNPQLYNNILSAVLEKEGNKKVAVESKEENPAEDLSKLQADELFNYAKDSNCIKYETGKGYRIIVTGEYFGGNSKESAIKAIEDDKGLRLRIEKQLSK